MPVTDERIDDFIDRWELVFVERISREEARRIATQLINFYRLIVRPMPTASAPAVDDQTPLEDA